MGGAICSLSNEHSVQSKENCENWEVWQLGCSLKCCNATNNSYIVAIETNRHKLKAYHEQASINFRICFRVDDGRVRDRHFGKYASKRPNRI